MLKNALLITSLSIFNIASCDTAPKRPNTVEYGVHADLNQPGFYGFDPETDENVYRPFDDPFMKGAQAVSAGDYLKLKEWERKLKEWGSSHCN